jgi:autotransporter-associated beta strand protein
LSANWILRLSFLCVLLVGPSAYAQACDKTWTGNGGNNDWFTANNWNPVGAPTNGQNICFTSNGPAVTPNISSSYIANSLTFSGNATVTITSGIAQSLQIDGGGITATNGNFAINTDTLVLGANQTWALSSGVTPTIGAPLQDLIGTETLTKSGAGSLTLSAPSFPLAGVTYGGGGSLTVTAVNALGSATPVTLATGSALILNSASNLNLGNDVTVSGASGAAVVNVSSSAAAATHILGTLSIPTGTSVSQTAGGTDTALQLGGLTLAGTALLNKTSTGNGGLIVAGTVTASASSQITLNIGIATPSAAQYDQGLHFTSSTTVNSTIFASGNGNSAMIGADGATTVTIAGAINFGAGNPRAILIGRSGGRIVFGPSSFGSTNQDTQIRGDSTGVVEFSTAAASSNGVSIFDGATLQTDVNSLPAKITFQPASGGSWLVRNVAQTFPVSGTLAVNAPAAIDTGANLTLSGAVQGSGAITKTGSGTLALSDYNSYSGAVTVNAGTIALNGSSNNATQSFAINGGATLTGTGSTKGAVTMAASSVLTPGVGLSLGNTALNDTTSLNFTVGTSTTTVSTGTLTLDGILNITAGAGFAQGTFTLFAASATPANNVLRLGTAPSGFTYGYFITGNNVNLRVGPAATAVVLVKSDALTDGAATRITWEAGTEVRNLGYRVYRDAAGKRQLVSGLIPGSALRAGFDPIAGRNYSFVDPSARLGGRYWIEAIDMDGKSEWLGPVDVRRAPGAVPTFSAAMVAPAGEAALLNTGPIAKPVDPLGLDRSWRDPSLQRQWLIAAAPGAVKLLVRQDGVYRVPLSQLYAAGLPAGTPISSLQLWAGGRPVAFRAAPTGNAIEFFGQAADTRYTDTRVYWVTTGLGSPTLIAAAPSTSATATQTSFLETLQIRERTLHIAALMNPDTDGFFGPLIIGTQPLQRVFFTPALAVQAPDAPILEVSIQGLTNGIHTLDVVVNGTPVGTLQSVFQDLSRARFTLPPGLLVAGDNTVMLVGRTGTEIAVELAQRLTYPRQYSFSGPLRFTATAGSDLVLAGADPSSVRVLDITSAPNPAAVTTSAVSGGARLTASGTKGRILYAYRDQDVLTPDVVANNPSAWHASGGADLVIIGDRSLLPSLRPLAEQRASEGLSVAVVDVVDVYDEFSAGEKDALALRNFLASAVQSWTTPPRFVLLAGAATYDPRGWLGHPELDQVPTVMIQSRFIEAASDDALVTFDGALGPALAIGRLPLGNAADMDAAVAKIVGRILASKPDDSLLMVHDRDGTIPFSAASAEVQAALAGWNTQDFARGVDDAATHSALLDAFRAGPAAVDYQGHGAEDFWAGRILATTDTDALAGSGRSGLLVAATCLNAYFVDIGRESLGAALLRTPNGGSWGVWASSALTLPTEHGLLSKTLLSAALNDGLTLGEATLKAKAAVTDPDVRATFQLLGDPSARAVLSRTSALRVSTPRAGAGGCSTTGGPLSALAPLVLGALALSLRRRRPV